MEDSGIHPMPLFLIHAEALASLRQQLLTGGIYMRARSHGNHGQAHLSEGQERPGISERC